MRKSQAVEEHEEDRSPELESALNDAIFGDDEPEQPDDPPAPEEGAAPADVEAASGEPAEEEPSGEAEAELPAPPDDAAEPAEAASPDGAPADAQPAAETKPEQSSQSGSSAPGEPEPLTFTADGTEVAVEGGYRVTDEEGRGFRVVPDEAWDRFIQPNLADRTVWRREAEGYVRQVRELRQELAPERMAERLKASPEFIRAEAIVEKIDALLESPEAWTAFAEDFEKNKRILELELKERIGELVSERGATVRERETQAATRAQLEPVLEDLFTKGAKVLAESEEFKALGLKPDEVKARLWELLDQGVPVAQRDGDQIRLNGRLIRNYYEPALATARQREEDEAARRKAAAASARNALRLGQGAGKKKETEGGAPSAPPSAGAKGGAQPPKPAEKLPESKEDWDRMIAEEAYS